MRRTLLLVFGMLGSLLAAGILCISAESMLHGTDTVEHHITQPTFEEITQPQTFPITIPGTSLIAERLSSYEGPFWEDGTDREVVNAAALHVYNNSDNEILKVHIEFGWADANFIFEGDHIPPRSTVVILEQNACFYRNDAPITINGWQSFANTDNRASGICISDKAMGTIVVTNASDNVLRNVCIYYKSWLSPPDVYMGGITYMVQVPVLMPGQTQHLYPRHYASEYSKVVSVTGELMEYRHS